MLSQWSRLFLLIFLFSRLRAAEARAIELETLPFQYILKFFVSASCWKTRKNVLKAELTVCFGLNEVNVAACTYSIMVLYTVR